MTAPDACGRCAAATSPSTGKACLPAAQEALDWSDEAWDAEATRYAVPWERHYGLPAPEAQTG